MIYSFCQMQITINSTQTETQNNNERNSSSPFELLSVGGNLELITRFQKDESEMFWISKKLFLWWMIISRLLLYLFWDNFPPPPLFLPDTFLLIWLFDKRIIFSHVWRMPLNETEIYSIFVCKKRWLSKKHIIQTALDTELESCVCFNGKDAAGTH